MKKTLFVLIVFFTININGQEVKFGKVTKAEVEEKFYPLDSTADAAYLYRYRKTFFEYTEENSFEIITEIHERIKIYTKDGFDKANKFISFYKPENGKSEKISGIKAYSFTLENGKINKQKLARSSIFEERKSRFRSEKKLTLPNIKEGTVIDIKYRKKYPSVNKIDDVSFQFEIPIKKLKYSIQIPEYYVFSEKNKGFVNVTSNKSQKNGSFHYKYSERGISNQKTVYEGDNKYTIQVSDFEAQNIPALKDTEPYVTDIKNYRGGLVYELSSTKFPNTPVKFFSKTWGDVAKQIYKSSYFGGELEKKSYFKNDIDNLLNNKKTDYEKIFAIYQFVKTKVKWNNYYGKYTDKGVRKAYKEGVGNVADINLMLTSMLRYADLNANPVLVSTRSNGIPLFPTINGFNYIVTKVNLPNNKYILLDASEIYGIPNILPTRALNWNGREVLKNGNSYSVKLNSSLHATEDNIVMIKVNEDYGVSGFIRTKFSNKAALNFRTKYNNVKKESLISNFETLSNIEVEELNIINDFNLGKPVNRSVKFLSNDLIEVINGKLYIEPLLFLTNRENPFKLNERKFPIDFISPFKTKNKISIEIPKGFTVQNIPDPLALSLPNNLGVFKYQLIKKGNRINVLSTFQINKSVILPQYYETIKEFFGKFIEKQNQKIVLTKV